MKKVADEGSEQVKKPTDTKKLDGSVLSRSQKDEVSDSESMLSEDDDFWTGDTIETFRTCTDNENCQRWQLPLSGYQLWN